MAKTVSQETFDSVVRENMEEFDMEAEEAINDAVTQFEAQGVDLSNIVRDLVVSGADGGGEHAVLVAVRRLSELLSAPPPMDIAVVTEVCRQVACECDKDLAHRCLAGSNGLYSHLLALWNTAGTDTDLVVVCLDTLCALSNGQPDLLDTSGQNKALGVLTSPDHPPGLVLSALKFIRFTCIKHETNRQGYVAAGLVAAVMSVLCRLSQSAELVKEACAVLRVLTFDDDMRVPFGKAHEHAKMIVTEEGALGKILDICKDYIADKAVLGELFSTLGRLAVRNEFCQEIMDRGGVQLMLETLETNMDSQGITRQVLGVLKAVAGNDQVKAEIVNKGGLELLLTAISKHIQQAAICEIGCAALATTVLRNPGHCQRAMDAGAADVIVKVLEIHKDGAATQKQACMAARNLVARTREHAARFLELGVEPLIQRTYSQHAECKDEAKAALRDLGCKVELQELWRGEGKGIQG